MIHIPTRKIKVVGCMNCPYLVKKYLPDNKYVYKCKHHSFCRSLIIPTGTVENLGDEYLYDGMIKYSPFPEWCPLEVEPYVCSCNNG